MQLFSYLTPVRVKSRGFGNCISERPVVKLIGSGQR